MAKVTYKVSEADFRLLVQRVEYIAQSVDTLLGNNKECPVYKKTVDGLVVDMDKSESRLDSLEQSLSNIKGRWYGISLLIGLGSSLISSVITFIITKALVGGL